VRFYLDSNVYQALVASGEVEATKKWLAQAGHKVLASDTNRIEAERIPSDGERAQRLTALVALADEVLLPEGFVAAREVASEIRLVHPVWMRRRADTETISRFLNDTRRKWRAIRDDARTYPRHEHQQGLVAAGAGLVRVMQREARKQIVAGAAAAPTLLSDSELDQYWRVQNMAVWWNALRGVEVSRDYREFLMPYLTGEVDRSDWQRFWLAEASGERVVVNRALALADYWQRFAAITAGNAQDAIHASHLLDADCLVTADRDFHKVLLLLSPHLRDAARPVYLNKSLGAPYLPQLESLSS
jgi:hypothetical protein